MRGFEAVLTRSGKNKKKVNEYSVMGFSSVAGFVEFDRRGLHLFPL
jgi:hypothetical protein